MARPTLIAGLAGGALCSVWCLRAAGGSRGNALPILTLVPVSFVMLSQTVVVWVGGGESMPGRWAVAGMITVLLVLSIAMLGRIAYVGVVIASQLASPVKNGETKPQLTGKPAAQAHAAKRA